MEVVELRGKVVGTVTEIVTLVDVMVENVMLHESHTMDSGREKEAQRESQAEEAGNQGVTAVVVTTVEVGRDAIIAQAEVMRVESVEVMKEQSTLEATTKDLDVCNKP